MERTENSISGKILDSKYEKIILGNIFSVYICLITYMKRILSSLPQIGRAGGRSEARIWLYYSLIQYVWWYVLI